MPETVLGVFSLTPHNNRKRGTIIIPLIEQIKLPQVIQLVSGKTNPRAPVFSRGAVGTMPQPPHLLRPCGPHKPRTLQLPAGVPWPSLPTPQSDFRPSPAFPDRVLHFSPVGPSAFPGRRETRPDDTSSGRVQRPGKSNEAPGLRRTEVFGRLASQKAPPPLLPRSFLPCVRKWGEFREAFRLSFLHPAFRLQTTSRIFQVGPGYC